MNIKRPKPYQIEGEHLYVLRLFLEGVIAKIYRTCISLRAWRTAALGYLIGLIGVSNFDNLDNLWSRIIGGTVALFGGKECCYPSQGRVGNGEGYRGYQNYRLPSDNLRKKP